MRRPTRSRTRTRSQPACAKNRKSSAAPARFTSKSEGGTAITTAQGPGLVYKLGTFERQGRTFVGIVLRDSVVIDYPIANQELARIDALYESREQPARIASPGRQARNVPAEKAAEYIFGYTIQNDVSDRGGRGDNRLGTDWLIGKSHDIFAPLGPLIVPKEFVRDPKNLGIRFTLNGELMQDANTSLMIHDVYELTSFGSNILTLRPGDVIGTGTPAGVGSARTSPVYLKPGDRAVCTYEGIGTLTNPVVGSVSGTN